MASSLTDRLAGRGTRWRHMLTPHGPRRRLDPGWYVGGMNRSEARGLVIGGASRSGTTLVRMILDSHPELACGPESRLFCCALDERQLSKGYDLSLKQIRALERREHSYPEFVRRVMEAHASSMGKRHWAEKTPSNVLNVGWILDRFPNVTFVHVVRDGRAVINSLRTHPKYQIRRGRRVATGIVNDLDWCITRWWSMVEAGLGFDTHPRVVRISYEDLLAAPRTTLEPVLARLELDWHEQLESHHAVERPATEDLLTSSNENALEPIDPASTDRWRSELTPEQIARIEARAGDLLTRLGYTPSEAMAAHRTE